MEFESESEESKKSPEQAIDAVYRSDSEESWSPGTSRKRNQASDSNVEMTEPAAKRTPRSSSARKASEKAKQKMVEENDDSTSEDEVIALDDDEENELEPEESTTGLGKKSSQKAAPMKVNLILLIEES
jgi:hypothetical protein